MFSHFWDILNNYFIIIYLFSDTVTASSKADKIIYCNMSSVPKKKEKRTVHVLTPEVVGIYSSQTSAPGNTEMATWGQQSEVKETAVTAPGFSKFRSCPSAGFSFPVYMW